VTFYVIHTSKKNLPEDVAETCWRLSCL